MSGISPAASYVSGISSWLAPPTVAAIRRDLPELAEEIVQAIQREVPGYSRPLRGEFGIGIRSGVELALRRFIGDEETESRAVYRSLGYGELRAGRTLDSLQSAYRVGARVAWQSMSQAAERTGATAEAQRRLAGDMFSYIEDIAAESVEGYAEAQLAHAGDRERQRAVLFARLLSVPAVDPPSLASAAAEALWRIPASLACLAVDSDVAAAVIRRLSGDSLYGQVGDWTCIVVPDPSRVEHEARAIANRLNILACLGPSVAVAEAHVSLRWASLARELPSERAGLVVAERRLADIALCSSPDILAALADRVLLPLQYERASSRVRLEATLHAWLRHHGSQRAIAAQLEVHPQTIRYRLRRLRELFGDDLNDPDTRFALEVALRNRSVVGHRTAAADMVERATRNI